MRYLLIVALLCSASAEAITLRQRWQNFCEKHLIAEGPWYEDEQYGEMILFIKSQSTSSDDYVERLAAKYREAGGKLHWLQGKREPTERDKIYISVHRKTMQAIEFEFRLLDHSKAPPTDRAQKAREAALDYSYLLRSN